MVARATGYARFSPRVNMRQDLAELSLHDRAELGHEPDLLRGRRAEMDGEFAFDHVSFA